LHDTAISMLTYFATSYLRSGVEPRRFRHGSHSSVVPSQSFATRDGWVLVMCMKDKFWQRLNELLERPDLPRDPRYAGFAERLQHRDALLAELEPIFRTRTTAEWIALLRGQVPCAPVNNLTEALADEQVAHRSMIVSVEHPRYGTLREVGCPIKIDDIEPRYAPGAALGADTDAILSDLLGMSAGEIAQLRDAGAI
jgi:crotonobetainyl-CoA:carnitine CoA-transferase CaiB-like acyl-CoA transferase